MAQFKTFAVLVLLALAGSAAAKKKVVKKDAAEGFTSVLAAVEGANLTLLETALGAADLLGLFGPDFEGTVFAPTDAAFTEALAKAEAAGIEVLGNTDLLTQILAYHVVNGTVAKAGDLKDQERLETLADKTIKVVIKKGKVQLRDAAGEYAEVIKADVPAGKAVVHVIDKVLLPMALANATDAGVMAPTDVPAELPTEPVSGAAGLMASAAAVAASLIAAAFLA